MALGFVPVEKSTLAEKEGIAAPGAVVFSRIEMEPEPKLQTARSGLPSALKSATAIALGFVAVVKSTFEAKEGIGAPGAVVFSSTETELELRLATTKSCFPSPLMSAAKT